MSRSRTRPSAVPSQPSSSRSPSTALRPEQGPARPEGGAQTADRDPHPPEVLRIAARPDLGLAGVEGLHLGLERREKGIDVGTRGRHGLPSVPWARPAASRCRHRRHLLGPVGLIGTTDWTFLRGPVPLPPRGALDPLDQLDQPGGIHEATGLSEGGDGHGGDRCGRRMGPAGTLGGGPVRRGQVARLRGRHARGGGEPDRRHAGVAAAAAPDRHRLLQEPRAELDRQRGRHPRVPGRAVRRGRSSTRSGRPARARPRSR